MRTMLSNNTTKANPSNPDHIASTTKVILTSIFIAIVMLAAIVGNSLVVLCVSYFPRLRGRTNFLIVSLAIADWLVGTLSLPMRLAQTVNNETWPFTAGACRFWIWIDMLCSAASILSLAGISLDRLIAVLDPLKYEERMRQGHVFAMITGTWLLSLTFASLSLAKWNESSTILSTPQCSLQSKEYITFVSIASFFVPLAVVIVNYSVIFRIAMGHAHRLRQESRSLAVNYCAESKADTKHHSSKNDRKEMRPRKTIFKISALRKASKNRTATFSTMKQLKATKTLAVVVGVFIICWLPFFVIFLTFQYCGNACFVPPRMSNKGREALLIIFIRILPVLNSAANPIIYSCYNAEFRKAFKRMLATLTKRKGTDDPDASVSFTAMPSTSQKEFE